jgi:ribonuclease PH
MALQRSESRTPNDTRVIELRPNYYDYAEGSCLVRFGRTEVLCVATVDDSAPPHLRGKGQGWITGEYSMLPRSSPERIRRERERVGGRTHEIQRLIGRALRSVVKLQGWGERTITLDCDVLRADGGTRTAAVTGSFVAMVLAFRYLKKNNRIVDPHLAFPVKDFLSAISVGIVEGSPVCDLDYREDSRAETDMNLVMTASGGIVEVQGTAEKEPFTAEQFEAMLGLGRNACQKIAGIQKSVLGPLQW